MASFFEERKKDIVDSLLKRPKKKNPYNLLQGFCTSMNIVCAFDQISTSIYNVLVYKVLVV
jgi:hypothetical protein